MPAFHHRLQSRENLLIGEIARGAEEDQGVGMGSLIVISFWIALSGYLPAAFSRWPPKPKRIADSRLS